MKLPTLFACMIIRNEEENLHRCLSSIRELCDEIVAVDTGSTDRSVEILREYGAIVYPSLQMAYRKPPIWDFSFARNESLQYCQELGANWVFIVDGDEELQPIGISPKEFKKRLTKILPNVHALSCNLYEKSGTDHLISWRGTRFFRMDQQVYYVGICHNRPKIHDGYIAGTNLVMFHYGYSDENIMNQKRLRTLSLLEKRIRENDQDYDAFYYKTLTLIGLDRLDEAIETGTHCLEMLGPHIDYDYNRMHYFGALYYAVGWAYMQKYRQTRDQIFATRAYQWWMTGWEKWPNDIDLNYCLCTIGYNGMDRKMTMLHGEKYLEAIEKHNEQLDLIKSERFVNGFNEEDLAVGARHVHHATSKHEKIIRQMIEFKQSIG